MHQARKAFACSSGPQDAKIALVGEAWGAQEELVQRPFIGASGNELTQMLSDAGINRRDCFLTNVLTLRPPNNQLSALCAKKAEVGADYPYSPLNTKDGYLRPEYFPELERLKAELSLVKPNLIVALGGTASWALLQSSAIGSIRGATVQTTWGKCLPTYHPAGVMRNWSWRPIVIADFMKAKREMEFPEIRRPERAVLVNPTLNEIEIWVDCLTDLGIWKPKALSIDIETGGGQIKCIGFAHSRSAAIVIPFVDTSKPSGCYWDTIQEELSAWSLVRKLLESPIPKLFQNGVFDISWIMRMSFKIENCLEDTMLLHHSLYPEMRKGLGFLGSIYTQEQNWKIMNRKDSTKRDE